MKVQVIEYPLEKDWQMVYNICRSTMRKLPDEQYTPEFMSTLKVSNTWKEKLLEARHSPIRRLHFTILYQDVPHWVHVHLVRHHIGNDWYVTTSRNDRQHEFDRNKATQDHLTTLIYHGNAESLINIIQKRLCNVVSKETRELAELTVKEILKNNPEFAKVLVKPCEYNRGICHELKSCGYFQKVR